MKGGSIKGSIDWVQSNDLDMMGIVLAELDIVNEITLISDKLGPKDMEKMDVEF